MLDTTLITTAATGPKDYTIEAVWGIAGIFFFLLIISVCCTTHFRDKAHFYKSKLRRIKENAKGQN